ncbi:MAG: hypothetical protein AAF938_20955 [Myxococcota bacterium]
MAFYSRAFLVVLAGMATTTIAVADDDFRLMSEPTSFTDVADAADEGDPFDLNVHVAFRRTALSSTIRRETTSPEARGRLLDIADFEHTRNELELGLDIGLYRDVMAYLRFPLVLSDTRDLSFPAGTSPEDIQARLLTQPPGAGQEAVPLFTLPFNSATRSGVESITAGFAFSVLNQTRRRHVPTWTFLLEGRFGIGTIMNPCAPDAERCNPGVSEGTHSIRAESRLSRRYRFVELYSGIGYTFAWAGRAKDRFEPSGSLSGFVNRRPPMRGDFTVGASFVPWENRAAEQRFSFDVRARAAYVSEGRIYSPLFDALGSSQSPYLTTPNLEGIPNGSDLRSVAFNGLTDAQDRTEFGGTLAIELRAARYVRFRFGADLDFISAFFITDADACNTGVNPREGDARTCFGANGIINPHHRAVIDVPGQRFQQGASFRYRLFLQATAQVW